ncbi:MAG: hypothetical protein PHW13_04190 [Methylococcales bacterium]|nr:hypothetical protein [Methylococcales bacterium]
MFKSGEYRDLLAHYLFSAALLLLIVVYIVVCHVWGNEIRHTIDETERVAIRSVLYGIAIVLFPVVKLLRHIMIRLNQTMPGGKSAGRRYFFTISASLLLIETVGAFGFLMFILGDGFNTLYIFSVLALLGVYLHMPKIGEYSAIRAALAVKTGS